MTGGEQTATVDVFLLLRDAAGRLLLGLRDPLEPYNALVLATSGEPVPIGIGGWPRR